MSDLWTLWLESGFSRVVADHREFPDHDRQECRVCRFEAALSMTTRPERNVAEREGEEVLLGRLAFADAFFARGAGVRST